MKRPILLTSSLLALALGGLDAAGCDRDLPENRARAVLASPAAWKTGTRRIDRLRPGEARIYPLSLQKGWYLSLIVEQLGVDIGVTAKDPAGHLIFRVDSPNGVSGPEELFLVAGATGRYVLTVQAHADPGTGGRIALRVTALRPATPEDRRRADAAGAYSRARLLEGRDPGSPEAAALYRQSAALWAGLTEDRRAAQALYRLGLLECADPARRREGAETLTRALDLFERAGEERRRALGLFDLGNAWLQLGETDKAGHAFEQAAALWEKLDNPEEQAARWNDLALTHLRGGRIQPAIDLYTRAAEAWTKLQAWSSLATTRTNLGSLYASLGESRLAQDQYRQALALLDRQPDPGLRAVILNKLGDVLLRVDGPQAALEPFREALKLRRELGNAYGQAVTLNSLGQAHLEAKEPRRALRMFETALAIFQQQAETLSVAIVLNNQGLAYERLGQPARARQLYRQALALAVHESPHLPAEETSLFGLARVAQREGKLDEAESFMEQTLKAVEDFRRQVWRQDLRSSYQDARQKQYAFLIDLLAERHRREPRGGHDARAFAVAERARARSLLELLSTARRKPPPEELRRLDALSRQINDRHREQLAVASEKVEDRLATLIGSLRQTEAEVEGPRLASLPVLPTLSLQQVQSRLLDSETLFLEYFLGEERSFLWAVTPSAVRFISTLPGKREIEAAARRTAERLTESHQQTGEVAARQAAAQLSRMLLAPVADLLGRRRLVVVAPGALQLVPFAALPHPGDPAAEPRPLIADHEIVSLPSASVLGALRSLASRPPTGLLAVLADPVTGPNDERLHALHTARPDTPPAASPSPARLPFAGREAAAILSLTGGEPVLAASGFAANRSLVQSGRLRDYRILHFATHGLFNDTYPELSALALSSFDPAGRPLDGHLRAYEIPALDLRADLVVLSACRTALITQNGEGFVSLTHGFLHAGVPRLIVSLWDVDDRATSELMQRFYTALLRRKLSPAQALRQAQLSLLREKRWHAPYYWAGFIFQGDWH